MTREFVMLVLAYAGTGMVAGDYGFAKPSFIIQPAGPSKQHAWVGYGYSDYLPLSIPKPYFIPKWIPHMDPTYTAFWVPETPAPAGRHKGLASPPASGLSKGFGPPKHNSVVVADSQAYASEIIPSTAIRAPLPPPPPPPNPLFDSIVTKSPLSIGSLPLVSTTRKHLTTYAPAPLIQSDIRVSPLSPTVANIPLSATDSSFVDPKGQDIISNSVLPQTDIGDSTYVEV